MGTAAQPLMCYLVEWYRPGAQSVSMAAAVCAIAFDGLRIRR